MGEIECHTCSTAEQAGRAHWFNNAYVCRIEVNFTYVVITNLKKWIFVNYKLN